MVKAARNDPLFPPHPKSKPTKSARFKRTHLYEARRARIRMILDRTAKARAEIDADLNELDSATDDPGSLDDTPIEYPPGVSLHDNTDSGRMTIYIDIATYHRLLYEAMKRRRTPNQVTDELVNEALDRVAEEIKSAAIEPLPVSPAPRAVPDLCPHGSQVGHCRQSPACYEQLQNKAGRPPAAGPACDVSKGARCPNPLYWRGRARCGCSRPSRSAA